MNGLRRRHLPTIPASSPHIRRLSLGVTLHELGAATDIPIGRLSVLERFPDETTLAESEAIQKALDAFAAGRASITGGRP